MKLGIYGGTFNPPHLGHLTSARLALDALGLDELRFVPAALPPHKRLPPDAPGPEARLEMVELAADGALRDHRRDGRIDAAGESDNHTCHTFCANFTFRPHRKARFAGNIRSRKHRFSTDSRYSSISPSGSTIFTVRPSKSMPAMNSSTAGTRIRLPPISTSKRGLASLS